MKFSKLLEIAQLYRDFKSADDYVDSEVGMSVIIGCDCGCGGDYLDDVLDDPIFIIAPTAIRNFCTRHGVELDVAIGEDL